MVRTGEPPPFSAPDQGLGARQQFSQIERLGDVVIGAGIQQGDDRLFLVARRDYQDRRILSCLAQLREHLHAIELGQHQVQQNQIIGIVLRQE